MEIVNTYSHLFRRAFRVALAIFIATWISHYFSKTEEYWIATSALMVMKTSLGAPLREHLIRFIVILVCVFFSSLVLAATHDIIFSVLLTVTFLVIWALLAVSFELEPTVLSPPLLIAAILLVAILSPYDSSMVVYNRVHDITTGALVGTLIGLLILPERIEVIFRNNIVAILTLYSSFFSMIIAKILQDEYSPLEEKKLMSAMMQSPRNTPDWVYHSAFNPGLKKSYCYFLSTVIQVSDALFSLHYISKLLSTEIVMPLDQVIKQYSKTTQQLFDLIISKMKDESLVIDFSTSDFSNDVIELEKQLQEHFPMSLEFLSVSKESAFLAAYVRDLRELRMTLIRLAEGVMYTPSP